ncbi:hypothetical protein [Sinorhizobium americanum]|uniref:hypothetical protein n=1 Tax=Sinorhizobium americanum TaxID=194963 RepID=UPI000564CCBB
MVGWLISQARLATGRERAQRSAWMSDCASLRDRHEAHRRPACGFRDHLGVLIGDIRPDLVAHGAEHPTEVMRSAAGLHRHDASRQAADIDYGLDCKARDW